MTNVPDALFQANTHQTMQLGFVVTLKRAVVLGSGQFWRNSTYQTSLFLSKHSHRQPKRKFSFPILHSSEWAQAIVCKIGRHTYGFFFNSQRDSPFSPRLALINTARLSARVFVSGHTRRKHSIVRLWLPHWLYILSVHWCQLYQLAFPPRRQIAVKKKKKETSVPASKAMAFQTLLIKEETTINRV